MNLLLCTNSIIFWQGGVSYFSYLLLPNVKQSGESKITEAMFRLNQSSPEVELVQKMLVFLTISLLRCLLPCPSASW